MRERAPVALLGVCFTLLLAAWMMSTPPFAAPDEASHYLRALTIAHGRLLGPKIAYPNAALSPAQLAFVDRDTRAVEVAARLSPPDVLCIDGKPDLTGCVEATPTGDYYPVAYLLPAVALKVAHDSTTGLWLARLGSVIPCAGFLVLAIAMLWDADGWSLLGLLAALTPMVLFVCSVLNPSGLETAACATFAAAVLRIARDPPGSPRWVWLALAVSGAVAILAWQVGPGFVATDLAIGAALIGRGKVRDLRVARGRDLRLSGLLLIAAMLLWLVYSRVSGVAHSRFGLHPFWSSLHRGLEQLAPVLHDAVGTFGGVSVQLPAGAHWTWWLLVLACSAAALWLGDRRERLVLGAVVLFALAFPILSYAWVQRYSGFEMQGRYVLPALMLIPLVSGEVIYRHHGRFASVLLARLALAATTTLIAGFQVYAWWLNAHIAAGAPDTLRFYAQATWRPPLGWLPWVAIVLLAALGLLSFAATEGIKRGVNPVTHTA